MPVVAERSCGRRDGDLSPLAELCRDDGERALLASALAKEGTPFGPRWVDRDARHYPLAALFADLCL